MKKLLLLGLFFCLAAFAPAEDITVAAAADLNYAMKDLASRFEQKAGNKVTLTFGASGNLYAQIQNGAPYDLFFSADAEYPRKLAKSGLLDEASLRTYAIGHLVALVHVPVVDVHSPATAEQLRNLLLRADVKRIALANPEHAPYGRAAMAALERLGIKDKVASKLVLGENVSQAAQFVQSGNAQVGLISLSLALSPAMKQAGSSWEVPADAYPEMQQVAGIVAASKKKQAAQSFLAFVVSPEGKAVLKGYGFGVPAQP